MNRPLDSCIIEKDLRIVATTKRISRFEHMRENTIPSKDSSNIDFHGILKWSVVTARSGKYKEKFINSYQSSVHRRLCSVRDTPIRAKQSI